MIRLPAALLAAASLASCAGSQVTPIENVRPAALMERAWAAAYQPGLQPEWSPKIYGDCSNKVAWAIQEGGRGSAIIGFRNFGQGSVYHAALLVDDVVYDWDGAWQLEAYPMKVTEILEVMP